MEDFDFLESETNKEEFVSETELNINREMQMEMAPNVLNHLRRLSKKPIKQQRVEFFFDANSEENAKQLALELEKLRYYAHYKVSISDKNEYLINGWTTKMDMSDDVFMQWVKQMTELAYKFDCIFDGWGTYTDMEEDEIVF